MATEKFQQPKPIREPLGENGYPATGVKTTGIKVRGRGNQTKGKLARGPMA